MTAQVPRRVNVWTNHLESEKGGIYLEDDATAVEEVVPKPMRFAHVRTAADASERDIDYDPLSAYLFDLPHQQRSFLKKTLSQASNYWGWYNDAKNKLAWTINGESFIVYLKYRGERKKYSTRFTRAVESVLAALDNTLTSKEEKLRFKELRTKEKEAVTAAFGEKVGEMAYINNLITVEKARGRGHGTSLMHMATSKADAEGREAWLVSSNAANVGLYQSLGFHVVERFSLGEDNPKWTREPVSIDIMVRYPQ